jgi:L-ascorbate metabolism protein UlaG (beta-lactamase superfamily)
MEITYFGANCLRLTNKKISVIIDDNLEKLGLKSPTNPEDIVVYTLEDKDFKEGKFLISGPGEYEIADVSIRGIPARANIDADGERATIYSIQIHNFSIGVIGHIYPDLSDEQLEVLGLVDVLLIPVGGNGYTVDAHGALQLVKKIEPKIVIPTHYSDSAVKYEVPQADIDVFLKEMGITDTVELQDTFVLKESELGDKTKLIVLNRTAVK